jgi:hypothetical protein
MILYQNGTIKEKRKLESEQHVARFQPAAIIIIIIIIIILLDKTRLPLPLAPANVNLAH